MQLLEVAATGSATGGRRGGGGCGRVRRVTARDSNPSANIFNLLNTAHVDSARESAEVVAADSEAAPVY